MATLYKRAKPHQRRMIRIIEGAIKNALDAHPGPDNIISEKMARSITKRAVGTLSAQILELKGLGALAAENTSSPSVQAGGKTNHPEDLPVRVNQPLEGSGTKSSKKGSAGTRLFRRSLLHLHKTLGNLCGQAKRAGNKDREEAFKEALRELAKVVEAL